MPELKALTKNACRVLITHDKLVLERIAKEVALVEAQMHVRDTEIQMHQARATALEAEARVLEAEARVLEAEARVLEAKNSKYHLTWADDLGRIHGYRLSSLIHAWNNSTLCEFVTISIDMSARLDNAFEGNVIGAHTCTQSSN